MTGICSTALLDGGPADGERVHIAAATELTAPEVVVQRDGVTHRYVPAVGPIADRWWKTGVALYTWRRP
jgi:hypothetical protein